MASAADQFPCLVTHCERLRKETERRLIRMQEDIKESLKLELQPMQEMLQNLHLSQERHTKSVAAQRDMLLVELMKMHAETPASQILARTLQQPSSLCNGQLDEDQSVLPSIETQTPDERDPSQVESRIHASSVSESEVGSEVYEPQDTLPDHVDDDAVNIGSGLGTNHEQKRAHCTEPARHSRWNMHYKDRKSCAQSAPTQTERAMDDLELSGDDADTQQKKRPRMAHNVR